MNMRTEHDAQLSLDFTGSVIAPVGTDLDALHLQDLTKILKTITRMNETSRARIQGGILYVPYTNNYFFEANAAIKAAEKNHDLKAHIKFEWQEKTYDYDDVVYPLQTRVVDLAQKIFDLTQSGATDAMPKPIVITTPALSYADSISEKFLCQNAQGQLIDGTLAQAAILLNFMYGYTPTGGVKNKQFIISAADVSLKQVNPDDWESMVLAVSAQAGNTLPWTPPLCAQTPAAMRTVNRRPALSGHGLRT